MAGGIKLPTPQQSIYGERGPLGGRITARVDSHAAGAVDTSSIGRGLGALAGGINDLAGVLERQEYQAQTLEAMDQVQSFQDREREALAQMKAMEGEIGYRGAVDHMEAFYAKEGEALKGQAKGDFQKMYYEKSLATARDSGLNLAFGHRTAQLDAWQKSSVDGEMTNLFLEADHLPGNWESIEARGINAIRLANPGLDTTAKEQEFRAKLAEVGAGSAALRGDTATARAIVHRFGDTAGRAKMEEIIATAESKARVEGIQREGAEAYNSGETVEFRERLFDRFLRKEISYDELDQALKGVAAIEENDRKARKEREEAEQDATRQEMAQLRANNSLTNDWILNSNLPGDEKDRAVKELTSERKPSLDGVEGRGIDFTIRMAIDDGSVIDARGLNSLIRELDPEARYVSAETFSKYESRLKERAGDDGHPKRNYFAEALDAVGKRKEFQGKEGDGDSQSEGALLLLSLKNAVYEELDRKGISVFDQMSGQMIKDAVDKYAESQGAPGAVSKFIERHFPQISWAIPGPGKERWFLAPRETRGPLLRESGPQPAGQAGGVGGVLGASSLSAGAVAQTAMSMLTDSPMNARATAFTQVSREMAQRQGLPNTPFSLEWVGQGLRENKPAREVTPDFAQDWPGQGRVSLTSLGKVHDYNDLIEKHALSQGIDPNLIAAMMYTESRGDRFAKSGAGAQGLMQFMPDTARRFGITGPADPEQSIRGACQYMRFLLDRFDGNVAKAVGAYNSGEGTVDRGRVPDETRKYVPQVLRLWMSAADDGGFATLTGRVGSGQPAQLGGLVAPLANMLGTSRFGMRNTGITGASRNHQGLDLRAPIGTPVGAAGGGVVETAGYKGKNGNYVVIRHDDGRKTFYLHLKGFKVKTGQRVEPGQLIGHSGNSGDFKKPLVPHLDFRVWENGKFVDPAPFFAGMQFKKGA